MFAKRRLIERKILDLPVPLIPKITVLFPSNLISAVSIALKFFNESSCNRIIHTSWVNFIISLPTNLTLQSEIFSNHMYLSQQQTPGN